MNLGKVKKQKDKKQKSGGGLLSLFKKNKDKKNTQKKDRSMAKKQKKTSKKESKASKKAAKKQSKIDAKNAKAQRKQIKQLAKQNKERKGASNVVDKIAAAKDTAQFLAPELYDQTADAIKDKLNINQNDEEMSDQVTNSENSSGEMNTASAKEEGFFSKHKALLIGVGIVAVAGIVTAVIFSKKKPTQAVAGLLGDIGETDDDDLGYIEPIDLS